MNTRVGPGYVAQNPNSNSAGLALARSKGYPDAPDGYHWGSDGRGGLIVKRDSTQPDPTTGEVPPQLTYIPPANGEPGRFVQVDPNVLQPRYAGLRHTQPLTADQKTQNLLGERDNFRQERDRLQNLKETNPAHFTPEQQKQLSRALYEINERSRQIGEIGAESYIRQRYPADKYPGVKRVYGGPDSTSRSGDFDQVWRIPGQGKDGKDLYIVIESKGGASPLGTRRVGKETASQGTKEYFDEITRLMRTDESSPEARETGRKLTSAKRDDNVQYLEIRTGINNDNQGNSVLGNVNVKEFDISDPQQ
jgi:hypothetical protein